MELRTKYQVAFDLWCIHENYRVAGRCPEDIAALLDRLRERHPHLSEPLIEEGLDLFTEQQFQELERRLDRQAAAPAVGLHAWNPVCLSAATNSPLLLFRAATTSCPPLRVNSYARS